MVKTLSPSELVELGTRSSVVLVDVRDQSEFVTGYIEGSRLIPLETLRQDPEAVLERDVALVFVCAKGVRSLAAAKLAERFGYAQVFNLEGGTKQWVLDGFPLMTADLVAA